MAQTLSLNDQLREVKNQECKTVNKEVHNTICNFVAQVPLNKVLKEGQKFPNVELFNSEGKLVRLNECLKKGPLVLTFYRGVWCNYCTTELKFLQQNLNQIHQVGGCLIGISPQLKEYTQRTKKELGLGFELLIDENAQLASQLGIAFDVPDNVFNALKQSYPDLEKSYGNAAHKLALPATFIIDTTGKICKSFVTNDFTKRMEPTQIIEVLKTCSKAESS